VTETLAAFGRLLRDHRRLSALTQVQLADLSTLSVRAIRDLERGRAHRPRPNTVRLLADGLELRGPRRAAFEAAATVGAGRWLADELRRARPPAAMSALLGREAEVRVLTDLLFADGHRVVTVTGLAGVGKTRLAIEVVGHLDAFRVLWTRCDGGRSHGLERTADLMDGQQSVLVLDGRTHPVPDRGQILDLLHDCPGVRVLATADAPLGLPEERAMPLSPLAVPDPCDDMAGVARSPSVRLLLRHIRALNPAFRLDADNAATIAGVCRRCDGHPRAVELAAMWCALRSPDQVYEQLAAGLPAGEYRDLHTDLLRGLATLGIRERRLLTRLLPLRTAWTVDEAAALTGDEPAETAGTVHGLLLRGLLRASAHAGRFELLNLVRSCLARPLESATA